MLQNEAQMDKYILESIKNSLEQHLGDGSAYLVFKTLKLVYRIDEDDAIRRPEILEEKLEKMLGRSIAGLVLEDTKNHNGLRH